MTNAAASLVESAKEWASHYGDYPNGREGAVLTAVLRARAAWADNDADAFAKMFLENGSMLVGDRQLTDREEIRSYIAELLAGPYQGSRLTDEPSDIRLLTDSEAVAVTEGGVLPPGEERLAPTDQYRTVWVVVQRDGDWRIASYQSSPVTG